MILYLIRGLPGSGKSTLANALAQGIYPVFEADQYFMKNGVYEYNAAAIGLAHESCEDKALAAIQNRLETIIVANTFVLRDHMKMYYYYAKKHGYKVIEIAVSGPWTNFELAQRNVHNVPEIKIEQMRRLWQP